MKKRGKEENLKKPRRVNGKEKKKNKMKEKERKKKKVNEKEKKKKIMKRKEENKKKEIKKKKEKERKEKRRAEKEFQKRMNNIVKTPTQKQPEIEKQMEVEYQMLDTGENTFGATQPIETQDRDDIPVVYEESEKEAIFMPDTTTTKATLEINFSKTQKIKSDMPSFFSHFQKANSEKASPVSDFPKSKSEKQTPLDKFLKTSPIDKSASIKSAKVTPVSHTGKDSIADLGTTKNDSSAYRTPVSHVSKESTKKKKDSGAQSPPASSVKNSKRKNHHYEGWVENSGKKAMLVSPSKTSTSIKKEIESDHDHDTSSQKSGPNRSASKNRHTVDGVMDWINRRVTGYMIFQNSIVKDFKDVRMDDMGSNTDQHKHMNSLVGKKWHGLTKLQKEEYKNIASQARLDLKKEIDQMGGIENYEEVYGNLLDKIKRVKKE